MGARPSRGTVDLRRPRLRRAGAAAGSPLETFDGDFELGYRNLVLATGARERFLPFPGWTLPNVMGAGGLQALAKSGLPIEGKKVVVAGSGPLLLAVAKYMRDHGADVRLIAEQADASRAASLRPGAGAASRQTAAGRSTARRPAAGSVSHLLLAHRRRGAGQLESVTLTRAARPGASPATTWPAASD